MNSMFNLFRVLTVGWMMLIFLLSSQSSISVPTLFSGIDKLSHALCYGVLGFFLARSLAPPDVTTWKRVLLVTAMVTAYGMTDEYHQSFVPGRDAGVWDVLADGAGGFLAALVLFWWDHRMFKILQFIPSPWRRGRAQLTLSSLEGGGAETGKGPVDLFPAERVHTIYVRPGGNSGGEG